MHHVVHRLLHGGLLTLLFSAAAYGGTWTTEFLGGMNVQVYTPTTVPQLAERRALMVSLHGCAQTAGDMRAGNDWEAVADLYGMVVALPDAPSGGVLAGCWDYYGSNHTRSNRHNDNLLSLVSTLAARATLNIDPRQIYISGLSSGASQSMVMACLAPEVFAGVGAVAGPTIGTTSAQIGYVATTQSNAVALCRQLAGTQAGQFSTQVASLVFGTSDFVVSQDYSRLNARVFAELYGATAVSGSLSIPTGGTETRWQRNGVKAVQLISVAGMAHAWPAGPGTSGGGSYIDHATINYPAVLTQYLFCANARVPGDRGSCDSGSVPPDPPPPTAYCGTDSNANHAAAARAIQYGSGEFASFGAAGSYQWLGYATTQTLLKETSPGYFVIGTSCP